MSKAIVIFLYGVTLYITLSRWYGAGNSGMPEPKVVAPASWLFGILALTADFLEGLPVILAAGLTFILYLQASPANGSGTSKATGGTMTLAKPPASTVKVTPVSQSKVQLNNRT